MKRVTAYTASDKKVRRTEKYRVHFQGPPLAGWVTLCGEMDRTTITWVETAQHVTCLTCLDTQRHVLGRKKQ